MRKTSVQSGVGPAGWLGRLMGCLPARASSPGEAEEEAVVALDTGGSTARPSPSRSTAAAVAAVANN